MRNYFPITLHFARHIAGHCVLKFYSLLDNFLGVFVNLHNPIVDKWFFKFYSPRPLNCVNKYQHCVTIHTQTFVNFPHVVGHFVGVDQIQVNITRRILCEETTTAILLPIFWVYDEASVKSLPYPSYSSAPSSRPSAIRIHQRYCASKSWRPNDVSRSRDHFRKCRLEI